MEKFMLKLEGSLYGKPLDSAHICVLPDTLVKIRRNKHKACFSWIIKILGNSKISYCELTELQE